MIHGDSEGNLKEPPPMFPWVLVGSGSPRHARNSGKLILPSWFRSNLAKKLLRFAPKATGELCSPGLHGDVHIGSESSLSREAV